MSKERRKKKGKGTMLPRCWWSWVLVAGEGRGKFVSKKKKKIRFEKQNRLVMACDKHHLGVNPN